ATQRQQTRGRFLRPVIAIACAALLVIVLISLYVGLQWRNGPQYSGTGPGAATYWELAYDQMFLRENQNALGIDYIEVNPKEIVFIYATTHLAQGDVQIQASSSSGNDSQHETVLSSYIQKLGQLGTYDVGVLHVRRLNRVGQVFRLTITFSDAVSSH